MSDTRHKNGNWNLGTADANRCLTWDQIKMATLMATIMDIRDELQKLNRLLHCQNFTNIPRKLDAIHKKMPARKKRAIRR